MTGPTTVEDTPLPPAARFLKRLVLVMTVVMVAGFVAMIAVAWRLLAAPAPDLPAVIDLPDGASVLAFTQGSDWFAVVTDDDRILIFDRLTGALRQTVAVE